MDCLRVHHLLNVFLSAIVSHVPIAKSKSHGRRSFGDYSKSSEGMVSTISATVFSFSSSAGTVHLKGRKKGE
jgi:hypothetical protein